VQLIRLEIFKSSHGYFVWKFAIGMVKFAVGMMREIFCLVGRLGGKEREAVAGEAGHKSTVLGLWS
jgi:hypothetical protein